LSSSKPASPLDLKPTPMKQSAACGTGEDAAAVKVVVVVWWTRVAAAVTANKTDGGKPDGSGPVGRLVVHPLVKKADLATAGLAGGGRRRGAENREYLAGGDGDGRRRWQRTSCAKEAAPPWI
jgi:hypothetical protein